MLAGGRQRVGLFGAAVMSAFFAGRTRAAAPEPAPASPTGPSTAAADRPNAEELRERGRAAYRARRFEEARDLWAEAYARRPDDVEAAADLALAYQHTDQKDQAIATNREVIRLASSGRLDRDKARRLRRGAYYNLGKLGAKRELQLGAAGNDGPSTCLTLPSDTGCKQVVFACGRAGAIGGADGRFDFTTARFALRRAAARIVEDGAVIPELESWAALGADDGATHDRADAAWYDVTLNLESQRREPLPGEGDHVVPTESKGCGVVHVDACARRIGLSCAWASWAEGAADKTHARAVELTFAR